MRLRTMLAGLTAAAALVLPALGAAATVAPTTAQKAAIVKAFGDPASASSCLTVRIAASDHNWASVAYRRVGRCQKWAFDGVNALERVSGNRWKVMFEGSSYRCPVAHIPLGVQRDLGICH